MLYCIQKSILSKDKNDMNQNIFLDTTFLKSERIVIYTALKMHTLSFSLMLSICLR